MNCIIMKPLRDLCRYTLKDDKLDMVKQHVRILKPMESGPKLSPLAIGTQLFRETTKLKRLHTRDLVLNF